MRKGRKLLKWSGNSFLVCPFYKWFSGSGEDGCLSCGVASSTFLILQPLGDCCKDCSPCAWSRSHTHVVDTITYLLPDSSLSAAECKYCSNGDSNLTPGNSYFVANHQSCIPSAQCCHQIPRTGWSKKLS